MALAMRHFRNRRVADAGRLRGSGKERTLKFSEVTLSSEPSPPEAGQAAKLIATIDNEKFAALEAEAQFQINSKNNLPSLIDAVKSGDGYTAGYTFPSDG